MNVLDYSMETITQEQEPIFQTPIIPDTLIPKVVKKTTSCNGEGKALNP